MPDHDGRPCLSIIIPTLNESELLGKTLHQLNALGPDVEVIVSDGGSGDGTQQIVAGFPKVRMITDVPSRAIGLNQAAAMANADHLLFLHADTSLPDDALTLIDQHLSDDSVLAGSFSLSFDVDHMILRFYSWISRLNVGIFSYGDQGLFLRKSVFERINGFADLPFMEDLDIQRRLRRMGRVIKTRQSTRTSARRFMERGIIRQQLRNTLLVSAFYLGVPPRRLVRFYSYQKSA